MLSFKSAKAAIDAYQEAREARLAKEVELASLKEKEKELAQHIMTTYPNGGKGTSWFVWQEPFTDFIISDFTELCAFMKKKGAFNLLYRRLNQDAALQWLAKGSVPGIASRTTTKLHHRTKA